MQKDNTIHGAKGRIAGKGMIAGLAISLLTGAAFSQAKPKVLDFWGVGGFAHGSRTAANTLLDSLAIVMNFELVKSDQASVMTTANLAQFAVVIVNNSTETGKIFNIDQRAALLAYMKTGGFVGMHGSFDTKGSFPDYTLYVGAELSSHGGGIAKLDIDTSNYAKTHPILAGLPTTISFDEEWYAYKTNPRLSPGVKVLYTLDEPSCPGCTKMGGDHPIMWTKEDAGGGRLFYFAMGHGDAIFKRNEFCKTTLKRAISWVSKGVVKDPSVGNVRQISNDKLNGSIVKGASGALVVESAEIGFHKVQLLSIQGKVVAEKSGYGPQNYTFGGLKSSTVYSVVIAGKYGKHARLMTVQ